MTTSAQEQATHTLIDAHATELKLPTIRKRFLGLADEAVREKQTPIAYLAALLDAEVAERVSRRSARRLVEAKLPQIKTLDGFVFSDNPAIPQATLAQLAQCEWIDRAENVLLLGESGTGKTHIATALAVAACQQHRRVRFTTLAGLANELIEAQDELGLARAINRYNRIDLLIIDELGYLALPAGAAELVFQVISARNEKASLIITTNLPFSEWTRVFADARLAKAVIDRLTHHAHIIDTGTESWRFNHGLTATARRKRRTTSK